MLDIFAALCATILNLEYPVDFKIDDLEDISIEGFHLGYYDENLAHTIRVCKKPDRGMLEVIAHEFAHAFVFEQHPNAKPHGRTFVLVCRKLRRELLGYGFPIKPLYLSNTDK